LISYAGWHVAERFWPAQSGHKVAGILRNLGATLAYLAIGPSTKFFAASCATQLVQFSGGPYIGLDLAGWSAMLPPLVGYLLLSPFALLPLFLTDFFYYWWHRLQHSSAWLWEQHKLHHTDVELNVTTSLRHHWLEDTFRVFFVTLPLGVLFKITPAQAGFLGVALGQWGWLIHANVRMPFGPLTDMFGGPQYHRIHHSIEPQHGNLNYATFFPFWDRLFGTYYGPDPGEWPPTGVQGEDGKLATTEVVFGPFMAWGRMSRASAVARLAASFRARA
jgi:sterol desaturase/sphingolipid hydroxylase (fatty acid hydroxylase superfamily)